jgi:hypothetical protein
MRVLGEYNNSYHELIIDDDRPDLQAYYEKLGFRVAGTYIGMELQATPPELSPEPPSYPLPKLWFPDKARRDIRLDSRVNSPGQALGLVAAHLGLKRSSRLFPQSAPLTNKSLAQSPDSLAELRNITVEPRAPKSAANLTLHGPIETELGSIDFLSYTWGLVSTGGDSVLLRLVQPTHGPRVPKLLQIDGYYVALPDKLRPEALTAFQIKDGGVVEVSPQEREIILQYLILGAKDISGFRTIRWTLHRRPRPFFTADLRA